MMFIAVFADFLLATILSRKVGSKWKLIALLLPTGMLASIVAAAVSAALSGGLTAEHAIFIVGYTLPNALLIGIFCWPMRKSVNHQSEGSEGH